MTDPAPNPFARFKPEEEGAAYFEAGPGPEVSLWERFKANAKDAVYNGTLAGSVAQWFGGQEVEGVMPQFAGQADAANREMIRRRQEDFETLPSGKTVVEKAVALAGQLGGNLATPETLVPMGKFAGPTLRAARPRVAQAVDYAVTGALTNLATDPVVQGINIAAGAQESYDPQRTVMGVGLGAVLPGALGFAVRPSIPRAEIVAAAAENPKVARKVLVDDGELSTIMGNLKATKEIDFTGFAATHSKEIAALKKEARRLGLPMRRDEGAAFVELYLTDPGLARQIAPKVVGDFEGRFTGDAAEVLDDLKVSQAQVAERRKLVSQSSLDGTLDDLALRLTRALNEPRAVAVPERTVYADLTVDGRPVSFGDVLPSELRTDKRFPDRGDGPDAMLVAFEPQKGKTVLIDGHGEIAMAADEATAVQGFVLREADGWTLDAVETMMARGFGSAQIGEMKLRVPKDTPDPSPGVTVPDAAAAPKTAADLRKGFHEARRGAKGGEFVRLAPEKKTPDEVLASITRLIRTNHKARAAEHIRTHFKELTPALGIARDAGLKDITLADIEAGLVRAYYFQGAAIKKADAQAYKAVETFLDAVDPQIRPWMRRLKYGRPKAIASEKGAPEPTTGLPHEATVERPAKGIADTSKIAQRVTEGRDGPPSVAKITRRLTIATGLVVRQGRIAEPARYTGGILRVRNVNDLPEIVSGVAYHMANLLKTRDFAAAKAFLDVNATWLGNVGGQVGRSVLHQDGADFLDRQFVDLANFLYLYVMSPAHVNKHFKALKGEVERFLAVRQPEALAALREARDEWQVYVQQSSADSMAGRMVDAGKRVGLAQKMKAEIEENGVSSTIGEWAARAYTAFVDDLNPIYRAARKIGNIYRANMGEGMDLPAASDPYKLARLGRQSAAAGHMDIMHGVLPYRGLKPEGPALSEAIEEALGSSYWDDARIADFGAYLSSLRLLVEWRRYLDGDLVNPPDMEPMGSLLRLVDEHDKANPSWRGAAMKVSAFARQLWKKKFEAGLITKEAYDEGLKLPFYVPLLRDVSDRGKVAGQQVSQTGKGGVVFRFRGSDRDIINPIQALMQEAYQTADIIFRNDVFKALDDMAERAGLGARAIVERLDPEKIDTGRVNLKETLEAALEEGELSVRDAHLIETLLETDNELAGIAPSIVKAGQVTEKGEPIVFVWRNGERQALRLADKEFGRELYDTLTNMNRDVRNIFINTVAAPTAILRAGVTMTPDFMMANLLRDQLSTWVLNPSFTPFVSAARGFQNEITSSELARLYNSVGGIMGGANVSTVSRTKAQRAIRDLRRRSYKARAVSSLEDFLKITEVSETATRLGLFEAQFKRFKGQGLSDYEAIVEAAFIARDNLDYGRRGSRMLHARRLVTFLNASIQGLDKSGRTLIAPVWGALSRRRSGVAASPQEAAALKNAFAAWTKMAAIGVFGLQLASLYRDDPEYEEISDHLKATHWMVKANGEWIAIPKPFDLAILSNIFERSYEAAHKNDPTAYDRLASGLVELLLPPMQGPITRTYLGLAYNKDPETGRAVVPEYKLGLDPRQQYDAYTSELSVALGDRINVSPSQIDYFLTNVGGTWARHILNHTNRLLDKERPELGWDDTALTRRFIRDYSRGANSLTKFWEQMAPRTGRLNTVADSYQNLLSGEPGAAAAYLATLPDDERAYAVLDAHFEAVDKRLHPLNRAREVTAAISGLRKQMLEEIRPKHVDDIQLTPGQKRVLDDVLSVIAVKELRNALIATGAKGWEGRAIMDPAADYRTLREISPALADELAGRVKGKVYEPGTTYARWPMVEAELLANGDKADLKQFRPAEVAGVSAAARDRQDQKPPKRKRGRPKKVKAATP